MNDPTNWLYQELAPVMDRLSLLTSASVRTRAINHLFGTHLTPREIDAQFADEDIELLLAWKAHTP